MPRGWCWQGCAPSTGSCRAINLCSCTQNGGGTSSYILQHAPETTCSWGEEPERRKRLESQRKASPTLIETISSLPLLLQTHLSVLFCSFHCYGDDPRIFWSSTQQILLYFDNCHARVRRNCLPQLHEIPLVLLRSWRRWRIASTRDSVYYEILVVADRYTESIGEAVFHEGAAYFTHLFWRTLKILYLFIFASARNHS